MSVTTKNPVVFVGTYTEKEGSQSRGIYIYRMDEASGELTFEWEAAGILNPSYLAIHPGQGFLYAVNEVQTFDGQEGGGVSALSIDRASGELHLLNAYSSRGKDPCYISVEHTGRFALVANYTGGNVAILPIQPDGRLGPATDVVQHSGSSVNPERQDNPYAHCILPDPANRFAIATDLGADKLLIYRMDLENGKLHAHAQVNVQPGAGPRHVIFHPNGQYLYLINELNSTLIGYRYHPDAGSLEELQTVSALPEDFTGGNLCAEVHISPDGKHLYASNRGHDSLICFFIDSLTGELTYRGHTSTGGEEPRNFAIDPTGTFLLVANQRSHNIVVFKIDAENGHLSRTGHETKLSHPVCVKFMYLE